MTNEEAIRECEWVKEHGFVADRNIVGTERVVESFDMAIEALKKMIPTKPFLHERDHDNYFSKTVVCGACGEAIDSYSYGRSFCEGSKKYCIEHNKFCKMCGTQIDWSAEI